MTKLRWLSLYLSILSNVALTTGDMTINPSSSGHDLGVGFEQTMSMEKHISTVHRNIYMHIRNISQIHKHLSDPATKALVQAFATSSLDYSNSLMYKLPNSLHVTAGSTECGYPSHHKDQEDRAHYSISC